MKYQGLKKNDSNNNIRKHNDICMLDDNGVQCYLRRMLSDTVEHRETMLSHGALKPVAALLHSDDTTLLLIAMKTVSCFICRLEFSYLYFVSTL